MLRDLRSRRTYLRLAYVLVAFPLATAYFVVLVTGLCTGLGLAVTLAGLPILVAMLFVWRAMAAGERALARSLLGEEIAAPYRAATEPSWWGRLKTRLVDPATWKDLVYLLVQFPLSVFSFTVAVTAAGAAVTLLLAPLWELASVNGFDLGGLHIDTLPEALACVPAGAVLALAALRVINWLGAMHGAFARLMLGASPDPELTAQVVDLNTARARIIVAADAERRRLERDLHDGAQQRLVSLALTLGLARRRLQERGGADPEGLAELAEAETEARLTLDELRELARGIHPAVLTDRGLDAALRELAGRSTVPVIIEGELGRRLAGPVESAGYFTVSEALANVNKYAEANEARVTVHAGDGTLELSVADDGRGGADPDNGSGLRGLLDRVNAVGGTLEIVSPPGHGTTLRARLPLLAPEQPEALVPADPSEEEATAQATQELAAPGREGRRRHLLGDHAAVFAVVNGALVAIWAVTGANYFWPVWPLIGWGAVLALHAALALRRRPSMPA